MAPLKGFHLTGVAKGSPNHRQGVADKIPAPVNGYQEREVFVYLPISVAAEFRAFDVFLDDLLERKRSLAQASLFPTERAEVNPEELFKDLIGINTDPPIQQLLTVDDLDSIDPYLFEAAVAVPWEKQGYKTILTPKSNDKGADVIALSDSGNLIFQVKHSSKLVGDSAVGEVLKSRGYYENAYQRPFSLAIVCNKSLTHNAKDLAAQNGIGIVDRARISDLISNYPIYVNEQHAAERNRGR